MGCGESSFDPWNHPLSDLESLREVLQRLGYYRIQVLPLRRKAPTASRLGHEIGNFVRFVLGRRNIFGVTLWPSLYTRMFARLWPREYLLYQLFFTNTRIPLDLAARHLGMKSMETWLRSGILREGEDGTCFSVVRVVPYHGGLYLTDPWDRRIEEMAYLSYDSLFLADWVRRSCNGQHFSWALDLCTGVGVLACSLSDRCDSIVGTDLNPRAVAYACTNVHLNGATNIDFLVMDLFEGLGGEQKFDLIVSNPPWVFLPASQRAPMLDSYGGHLGIEVTLRILEGLDNHLSSRGKAIVLSKAPVVSDTDLLLEKVRELFGGSGWKLTHTQICPASFSPDLTGFYHLHGISQFRMVVLSVERAHRYELTQHRKLLGSIRYQF